MPRPSKRRRMAIRKVEALQDYLNGNQGVTPLLENMGMRSINEDMARMKLAQLNQILNQG